MSREFFSNFELLVLLAVIRLDEDAYGVPIAQTIEDSTGREVIQASVYNALDRLENKGLLTSRFGDPAPERGGKARRYFKVTAAGLRQARAAKNALTAMWRGVPALERGPA